MCSHDTVRVHTETGQTWYAIERACDVLVRHRVVGIYFSEEEASERTDVDARVDGSVYVRLRCTSAAGFRERAVDVNRFDSQKRGTSVCQMTVGFLLLPETYTRRERSLCPLR